MRIVILNDMSLRHKNHRYGIFSKYYTYLSAGDLHCYYIVTVLYIYTQRYFLNQGETTAMVPAHIFYPKHSLNELDSLLDGYN